MSKQLSDFDYIYEQAKTSLKVYHGSKFKNDLAKAVVGLYELLLVREAITTFDEVLEVEPDDDCEHCGGSSKSPCFACSGAGKKT